GVDYEKQYTQGENRPDVVVFLPGDNRIVIDSKFPTTRYLEAMAVEDPDRRHQLLREHGKELEKVGRELVKKHYQDMSTAGYVVMYVPSQDLFEAAVEAHSDLIDRLMAIGVIVAGPVNVFALLKTAATIVAQHRAVKDAHLIIDQVKDVRNRLGVFAGHFGKIRSGLAGAVDAFQQGGGFVELPARPGGDQAHRDVQSRGPRVVRGGSRGTQARPGFRPRRRLPGPRRGLRRLRSGAGSPGREPRPLRTTHG